ncbi:hypothetical protein KNV00_gp144 [Streptomyces phage Bmoc]|uniref:Uncharacterized protein n=1 Tax=Streptomyces phage Bmoc TaxID=2725629 RepID=A0A6M3SY19_9CAUD|nr:hypothetical protein KNV00_gp144 [Streptomyces phage Bmoc]QJD50875.1 hypothetical protein SEA_BMOC_142 [Streptomyces phage Bmoc]
MRCRTGDAAELKVGSLLVDNRVVSVGSNPAVPLACDDVSM